MADGAAYAAAQAKWNRAKFEREARSQAQAPKAKSLTALVEALCSSRGNSALPPRDKLARFVRQAKDFNEEDVEDIVELIAQRYGSRLWQVGSKALAVTEALVKDQSNGAIWASNRLKPMAELSSARASQVLLTHCRPKSGQLIAAAVANRCSAPAPLLSQSVNGRKLLLGRTTRDGTTMARQIPSRARKRINGVIAETALTATNATPATMAATPSTPVQFCSSCGSSRIS